MRKKAKKTNAAANAVGFRRIKEGTLIVLGAMAIFFLVALITYNSDDPGWSRAAMPYRINNAAGAFGAWSADVLLSFFGYIAYLFPLLAAGACYLVFKSYKLNLDSRFLWSLHVIGFILTVTGACALINLFLTQSSSFLPGPSGGIIGDMITIWLVPIFNRTGSTVLFSAILLLGLTLATGMSWVRAIEWLGKVCISVMLRAASGLNYAYNTILAAIKDLISQPKLAPAIPTPAKFAEPVLQMEAEERVTPAIERLPAKKPLEKITKVIPLPSIPKPKPKSKQQGNSTLPDLCLLEPAPPTDPKKNYSVAALEHLSREVEMRLLDFGAEVKVIAVCPGPIITRFEMTLAPGLKVSKITGLAKDLARSLSVTSVRVVEVIPGKSVVGLEIPNKNREMVKLRDVLESPYYQEQEGYLNLALGKDISGIPVVVNLAKMPHLLVAGTTGSGKSVGVNAMLLSLLYKATPAELRLILIDPKMLELSVYDGIGHLLTPVVTDMNDAANALRWCVAEMERRYQLMAAVGVRNLAGFNAKVIQANIDGKPIVDPLWDKNSGTKPNNLETLPYIVVIIDEFADMMMVVGKKVEELIARIAQKARAAGIHMICATQRPSVDVITGLIKANIPTRIAFQVSSRIDSRTIIDQQGAEQLLGHGDMLYLAPGTGIPIRVHGAFVSDEEVHAVVKAIKESSPAPDYMEEIANSSNIAIPGIDPVGDLGGEQDPLYDEALAIVTESRKASISYLQRRLKIGYNRSARLIEAMEAAGVVSEMLSNGSREVLAFEPPRK